MKIAKLKLLPDSPGVYYFLNSKKKILYIGKATSLRDRVKSYFSNDLLLTRGPLIERMVGEARNIKFVKTDSALEALILEANEIKKHQPFYNSREKDDKSYNFVVITKENFPRVLIKRGRNLSPAGAENSRALPASGLRRDEDLSAPLAMFGPFPHGNELKEALKIIRKIFPYRDKCIPCSEQLQRKSASGLHGSAGCKPCFNYQIGLCPGICFGKISKKEYAKTIRHLKLFFEGKKVRLIKELEKEMKTLARGQKFEEASKIKKQIFALQHIQDVALLKNRSEHSEQGYRIEAYDIAHLSGKEVVGVMTVVEEGEMSKKDYRKFKIRSDKNNDTANLKEILSRRFNHEEWKYPNLVVVDGGKAQINTALSVIRSYGLDIPVVSVVKDEKHRPKMILQQGVGRRGQGREVGKLEKDILLANAEAHRFAIGYHRNLRRRKF